MQIRSLSISGVATLDLHALNNEGSEGNALMTRMVDIVDHESKLHTVNAISGDMLKHIQAEHLYNLAVERGLPLCEGCRMFNANRICADQSFTARSDFNKDTSDSTILSEALKKCTLDDAEGILITSNIGKSRSIGRKSCIEFGWAVGIPETTRTESYFHVKYVAEGRGKGSGTGENLGQNIFHRPASSGCYAMVVNVDPLRIGRNDILLEYAVDASSRQARIRGLFSSVLNTFVRLNGAHRNTQLPHLVGFQGVAVASTTSIPAPSVSALNPNFRDELGAICKHLNRLNGGTALTEVRFDSLSEFVEKMVGLTETVTAPE